MMSEYRSWSLQPLVLIAVITAWYHISGALTAMASEADAFEEKAINQDNQENKMTWAEVYAESESMHHEDYNLISDLSVRLGIHALKIQGNDLDLYFKGRIYADRDRLYWNNRYEFGLGTRYRPWVCCSPALISRPFTAQSRRF